MKYGAIPSNLLEQLALWSGRVPLPLIDALYPLIKCRALMCGVRLGLFEALRPGPLTGPEVAARCALATTSPRRWCCACSSWPSTCASPGNASR